MFLYLPSDYSKIGEITIKNLIKKCAVRNRHTISINIIRELIVMEKAVEKQLERAAYCNKSAKTLFVKELFFENSSIY